MATRVRKYYRFGCWRLDIGDRLLYREAELVALPPKVIDTLFLFVANAGHVLPKEEMLAQLWPDTFVEDGTLTQYISLLRKALGEDRKWIENVPRRGYRFTAAVHEISDAEERPATPDASRTRVSLPALRIASASLAVIIVVSALVWMAVSRPAPMRSLAVLPFLNLTGNPNLDYIGDGLSDELTHAVMRLKGVRVAARTSAARFRDNRGDVRRIAEQLNVTGVLRGSVSLEQDRIRVAAELMDGRTGRQVWSDTYDGMLHELLGIQQRIASATARNLAQELPADAAANASAGIFPAYLRGRYFLAEGRPETFRKAVECFREAIAKSPLYARAHSGLADSYYRWALWESFPPAEAFAEARKAAEQALALDETLAEAHASLANVKFQYDWDYAAAEREFRRSIALDPNRADTWHWFSHMLTALGRFAESETASRKAMELEPFDLPSQNHLGWCYYFTGDYVRAVEQHRRVLELDPVHGQTRLLLGRALVQHREFREAVAQLRRNLEVSPDSPERLAALAQAYAASGAREDATRILDRLLALARQRYVAAYSVASVYAALGAKNEALAYLEKAAEERSTRLVEIKYEPVFEALRNEPSFRAVVKRIGL